MAWTRRSLPIRLTPATKLMRTVSLVSVDPLDDVLNIGAVSGALVAQVSIHAPWGLAMGNPAGAAFHAITDGEPPRQLMPGDVVFMPTGAEHRLVSDPGAEVEPFGPIVLAHGGLGHDIELAGQGARTRFVCAAYGYDPAVTHPLLSLLPPALVLHSDDPAGDAPLAMTLRMLTRELRDPGPGTRAVVNALVDVLFVEVLRTWLLEDSTLEPSWLLALRDPVVARALTLMHEQPEAPWTIETLARAVDVSRATLARRFNELVGEAPLGYLTRWRMELAAKRLRDTNDLRRDRGGRWVFERVRVLAGVFPRTRTAAGPLPGERSLTLGSRRDSGS